MTEEVKSVSEQKKEDWMNSKWRPMMGWMYMLTCITDFVLFPILWSLLQTVMKQPITQWQPLTLQGAGLFHIAMGAVLGIAAYGRTQEKLGGANNGGIQTQTPTAGFSTGAPAFGASSTGFSSPSAPTGGFGATATTSFGTTSAPSSFGGGSVGSTSPFGATSVPSASPVVTGFGGKPAPSPAFQPEI